MPNRFWLSALIIVIIWGTIPILLKKLVQKHSAYPIMLLSAMMFGAVGLLLTFAHKPQEVNKVFKQLNAYEWLYLTFIVIAGSFFSNLLYMWALEKYKSSVLVTVTSTFPLVTVLLGVLILKERISIVSAIGILLTVIGVMCLAYGDRSHHMR